MAGRRAENGPPTGVLRWLMRAPIALYRARLGVLLGSRFLMLTHTGRKSGLPRRAVIEVVAHDEGSDTYYVASGFGERADWCQNIRKTPRVTVDVGRRRFETDAIGISIDEAVDRLRRYAEANPIAFRQLGKFMMGERVEPTTEGLRGLAQIVPMFALPARAAGAADR